MSAENPLYCVDARCHVCSREYQARYNVGRRAKICTPPEHVCRPGRSASGRRIRCLEECCRSQYTAAATAAAMNLPIDQRKVLSDQEYDQTMKAAAALGTPSGHAIGFLGVTGCRLRESLLVRRRDLHFQPGKLSAVRTIILKRKGRPVRTVQLLNSEPYVGWLRASTSRWRGERILFPITGRAVQLALEKILDQVKAEREGLAHILRHTRASQLIAAGATWNFVCQQLGWSSLETAKIYTHVRDKDTIARVMERV